MPLLVITDGGPGLLAAVELHFGDSLHQWCVIHRLRNAVAKVSKDHQTEFKADWWGVFDDIDAEPGDKAVAEGRGPSFGQTPLVPVSVSSSLVTKPKPTDQTASSFLRCDTGVTQTLVELFIFDVKPGHSTTVRGDSLLDTQEVTG